MLIRLLIITLFCFSGVFADGSHWWVFFADKAPDADGHDWYDQPVHEAYLQRLRDQGFVIRRASRWLNAASIEADAFHELDLLARQDFVIGIEPVRKAIARNDLPLTRVITPPPADFEYGSSFTQNELLDIPDMHALGYDGSGVRIAIFDTGFRLQHPAFTHLDVLATYDFIDNEVDVGGAGDDHGMNTLSILGGFHQGEIVGPAYGATYLLARTENDYAELPSEEDNWMAAMEWADSIGVDIISSSLNYRDFDDPDYNYSAADMDGETTIITQAANIAAQRGILVVNAMGNEGPGGGTLWAPADLSLIHI